MAGSQWYFVKGGKQLGPIPSSGLRRLVRSKEIGPSHLVWKEGLKDWIPAKQVKGLFRKPCKGRKSFSGQSKKTEEKKVGSDQFFERLSVAVKEGNQLPAASESSLESIDANESDLGAKPVRVNSAPNAASKKPKGKRAGSSSPHRTRISIVGAEAGVFLRFIPYLIDGFIFGIIMVLMIFVEAMIVRQIAPDFANSIPEKGEDFTTFQSVVLLGPALIAILAYFILLECSSWQRTPGKAVFGLKVTDTNGEPITFGASTLRTLTKFGPVFLVGLLVTDRGVSNLVSLSWVFTWLLAGVTIQKQALHDMIAGTVVIRESFVRDLSSNHGGIDYRYYEEESEAEDETLEQKSVPSRKKRRKSRSSSADASSGGFWVRTVSFMIDFVISAFIVGGTAFVIYLMFRDSHPENFVFMRMRDFYSTSMGLLIILPGFVLTAAYFWLMECSESGATLGKSTCDLKVVDSNGNQLSSLQSAIRQFAKFAPIFFLIMAAGGTHHMLLPLGLLVVMISFAIAGITPKKQAIHDILAGTYVVEDR
ncbi:MAG: RDD family protein [Planctomycetaceae bacterium]|nr:RDD family protein [Planctomycetaceae bacterium]